VYTNVYFFVYIYFRCLHIQRPNHKVYQEEIAKLKCANNALHQQIQYFKEKYEEIENKSYEAKKVSSAKLTQLTEALEKMTNEIDTLRILNKELQKCTIKNFTKLKNLYIEGQHEIYRRHIDIAAECSHILPDTRLTNAPV